MSSLLFVLFTLATGLVTKQTGIVLVGLVLQPMSDGLAPIYSFPSYDYSYVSGAYVDWIQTAGTEAVLIPFDLPLSTLKYVLDNIQMLVIPGGDAALVGVEGQPTAFQKRLHYIIEYAKKRNDMKCTFPVVGTCLGFESMLISSSGQNCSVLQSGFQNDQAARAMKYDPDAIAQSRIWRKLDPALLATVLSQDSLFYWHSYGITPTWLAANPSLAEQFRVIGTSVDSRGTEFVASVEHKVYPFIGNQWHPEETIYGRIPGSAFLERSSQAVQFMRSLILETVDEVRARASQYGDISDILFSMFASVAAPRLNLLDGSERMYFERRITSDEAILAE